MAIIKIPDGNAFKLRVTAMVNDVPADLNVVNNIIVNFVRRGRIAQPFGIDDNGRLVIANDGSLARGLYGVEITGYHDGKPWRHYIKNAFKIVDENEDADTPTVVDDVPVYDLSDNMSFGGDGVTAAYVDAAIDAHNEDEEAHPGLQTKIADKVDDVLVDGESVVETDPVTGKRTVGFHKDQFGKVDDVKVNGESVLNENNEAEITVPTKTSDLDNDEDFATNDDVDEKVAAHMVNEVNVSVDNTAPTGQPSAEKTFQDGVLDITFKNVKGDKGDPLTWNDLTEPQKASLKGPQGDSAIWDENEPHEKLTDIANSLGNSTVKPISQKGVSDAILDMNVYGWNALSLDEDYYYVAELLAGDGAFETNQYYRVYYFAATLGNMYRITVTNAHNSSIKTIGMCNAVPEVGGTFDVIDQYSGVTSLDFVVSAASTRYMFFCVRRDANFSIAIQKAVLTKEALENEKFVKSTSAMSLTDAEKEQARNNIEAASEAAVVSSVLVNLPATRSPWKINSSNTWVTTGAGKSVIVPIEGSKEYIIKTTLPTVYAWLAGYTTPSASNKDPQFCDGGGRVVMDDGVTLQVESPSTAKYLYLLVLNGSSQETGSKVYEKNTAIDLIEKETARAKAAEFALETKSDKKTERRIAEMFANPLTPTTHNLDENGWEIPTTEQEKAIMLKSLQMTEIVWTPKDDIPYKRDSEDSGSDDEDMSSASRGQGVQQIGLPYSSVKEIDKYIGLDVSIHTFMTAVNNPYSLLYTEDVRKSPNSKSAWGKTYHGTNCDCYYGVVCSVLTGYATGQPIYWPTNLDKWVANNRFNMVKVYDQSAKGLRIGDIYWKSGHNRLITGIKRDSNGSVTHITWSEATGLNARKKHLNSSGGTHNYVWPVNNYESKKASEGGVVYRNTELYRNEYEPSPFVAVGNETASQFAYNNDICCFAGDKACFREGDTIAINYNLEEVGDWVEIELYKDDTLIDTISIDTEEHVIDLTSSNLTYGKYKARMSNGNDTYSEYTEFEILETDVDAELNDGIHHITFDSANGTPVSWAVCDIEGTVYVANGLEVEDLENGYFDVDLAALRQEQHPDSPLSGTLYLKVYFIGEYGRVTNEPLEIDY